MRPIKFRFWNEKEKTYNDGKSYFLTSEGTVVVQSGYTMATLAEPPIAEQFTGVTDKNGKEIYEGDIVQTSVGAKEIGWNNEYSRFGFHHEIAGFYAFCKLDNFEVLGNIHENKWLLNGKEPLIKDEKTRKVVRAWAEANEVVKVYVLGIGDGKEYLELYAQDNFTTYGMIKISIKIQDGIWIGKEYTIAELCGEDNGQE